MNNIFTRLLALVAILSASLQAHSQSSFSPYSVIGIGELVPTGSMRSVAMGGIGVATPSLLYASQQNAAWLPFNQYTLFEGNFYAEYKRNSTNSTKADDASGNLLSLQLSFPVMRGRYGMAVGLKPLSSVNYALNTEEKLPSTPAFVRYNYRGSGGVSQAYWAHGLRLNKWLYLGLEAQYNFGSVTNESRSILILSRSQFLLDLQEQTTFSNVTVKPSLGASFKIDSLKYLNIGLAYRGQADLAVGYERQLQRRFLSDATISADTLSAGEGNVRLPQGFTAGISFEKRFNYTLGVDVAFDQWGKYSNSLRPQQLADAMRVSIGGEWTPDYASISSYLKRMTYRAGLRMEQSPWTVNNVQIRDIGINFGVAMPIYRGISSINWSFTLGQRGTLESNPIQERYFRVGVGLSINDTNWFFRRRIN